MAVFLGIDVGTSGTKTLVVNERGDVLAAATSEYPLSTPRPLWSEQDPADWWRGTTESISTALARAGRRTDEVEAVGLTGQMHGLVMIDAAGEVLRPAILWNDQRTAAECEEIHARAGIDRVIAITGKPALTGFTAPKILWVRTHEPDIFAAATTMLLPKDYVRFRMTGARSSDVADASGTSVFDITRRTWSDELVETLEVPRAWLPDVHESPVASATINAEGAAATGLREGTPVVAGAGDQAAEAIGCGIVRPGRVSVTIGTSGVVFAATERADTDPQGRLHAYCHAIPNRWHYMGVMLSAGGSLRWYRDTLAPDDSYDAIMERAALAPAGSGGVTFLPYLTGERTPHPDPNAQGALTGLTLRVGPAHLARAVIEGITFGLRDSLELAKDLGLPIERLRVSGGGARSAFWCQVMADVFGMPVATVNATQGAAFGAALLAGVGAGAWPDVETAAESVVIERERTEPSGDDHEAAYARFRGLYPALRPTWSG